jgi:hypothetical protein
MSWVGTVLRWGPSFAVAALAILALTVALRPPSTPFARRSSATRILLCGSLALAVAILAASAQREEARETQKLWTRLAGSTLWGAPLAAAEPAQIAQRAVARLDELREERRMLRTQLAALRKKMQGRSIAPDQAAKLEAYLARSGSHVAVVASLAGDVEAYQYANQIVHLLDTAGWRARGPEATAIFGSAPAMGINLYVPEKGDAEAAKILAAGFRKFDIPFATRVMPAGVIPAPGIVQLFVSRKP